MTILATLSTESDIAGFVSHIKQVNLNGSHLSLKTLTPLELHKLIEALKVRIKYEKQLLQSPSFAAQSQKSSNTTPAPTETNTGENDFSTCSA
ncbi:MAG: hypothetical protein IKD09_06000 [Lentisphaeria bacterium]|nr:hypothetical protein [Lentisphaeria bacterium]